MEEGSESRVWSVLRRIFGSRCDLPLEEIIMEARDDGELKNEEVLMLLNVLRLSQKKALEIMVPRTDLVCCEVNDSMSDVARTIIESGHSRIPIYRANRDHMVGLVHAKDLLKYFLAEKEVSLTSIMRSPYFIPETKNIREVLLDFQSRKIHMAIVLDEYGGTSGVVTLEDVLEEIVGEIEDEYDPPKPQEIQVRQDGSFYVSGRTSLDELKDELGIVIHSDQVETIGGYVCHVAGKVPQKEEEFSDGVFRYRVNEADAKHIQWLTITSMAGKSDQV
ncbi:hemolysin family protein [Desulfonatronovibrio hydrogenovorans]|uniref:hemolysin family protein n=1 Tax=Desulfonatronovibrio hydrogenovorans TaxID=53245 RepID=UPI00049041D0|nr:hemolysin family protein [Desulfonatronovibrio hydrogenovorans]